MEISLQISKETVFDEVLKTSSYTGAKINEDDAFERIPATDENRDILERFWQESKNTVCTNIKRVLHDENEENDLWKLTLSVSNAFDTNLTATISNSLFSFFVMNITGKWFMIANKEEAKEYNAQAEIHLDDTLRKIFFKKKPIRPQNN
jgi:hypothetical protein|nr:MAG TPA_asm: hypothetical protein [Caudoviricetes sp.]